MLYHIWTINAVDSDPDAPLECKLIQNTGPNYHPMNVVQLHRILWVQAWLSALGEPDSDAKTIVQEDEPS